jgi:hypothetical protein
MANNTLPCESSLGYTFTYALPVPPPTATGSSESAAQQAALALVPAETAASAQADATRDASLNYGCTGPCGCNISTGDVTYVATTSSDGKTPATWTATIPSAQVPVTVHCRKPKLATAGAATTTSMVVAAAGSELHFVPLATKTPAG